MCQSFVMARAMHYYSKLRWLMETRASAKSRGDMRCHQCGICCWNQPGALTHEDIETLAANHGMTINGFFSRYCVVSERLGARVPRLVRANEEHLAGRYITDAQSWNIDAPCVFLVEENGVSTCGVYTKRPAECMVSKCWELASRVDAMQIAWSDSELIALGWDGKVDGGAEEE